MQRKLIIGFATVAILVGVALAPSAQEKSEPAKNEPIKYEYGIVKWDGGDKIFINLPSKFELMHVKDQGVGIPRDAQEEEWCLTYAANQLGKEGWEPINLDSRRLVFRRVRKPY